MQDLIIAAVCIVIVGLIFLAWDASDRRRARLKEIDRRMRRIGYLFVSGWLRRPTGREACMNHPELGRRVCALLALRQGEGELPSVPDDEGVGTCSCSLVLGGDVRFRLDDGSFMGICPACDSWAEWPTRDARGGR